MSDRYSVIYADPPWWFANRSANRKTKFGYGAHAHYSVMRDDEILALGDFVQSLAADNCALFLWATGARLDLAMQVLSAWGFRFATVVFVWEKITKRGAAIGGPGYYTSPSCEYVLLGIKGKMQPEKKLLPQLTRHPRLRHSEKPAVFRRRIEQMYPNARRIELFARCSSDGWDVWGNEVDKFAEEPRLALEVA
jgi:site-specific DNA-methyltransferase (adenine-specific)